MNSVAVLGSLSTTSELFHHPNDPDLLLRSEYFPLNTVFGAGLDFRRVIPFLRISVGTSVEFLSKSENISLPVQSRQGPLDTQGVNINVPVNDGYRVVPVELSAYIPIPVGTEDLQFYIGAGGGAYFGERRYTFGGSTATTTDRSTGYGIQIIGGSEYFLAPRFSLRSELKFRDVHFETVNQFPDKFIHQAGYALSVPQGEQVSRVNIDGLFIALHFAYHF